MILHPDANPFLILFLNALFLFISYLKGTPPLHVVFESVSNKSQKNPTTSWCSTKTHAPRRPRRITWPTWGLRGLRLHHIREGPWGAAGAAGDAWRGTPWTFHVFSQQAKLVGVLLRGEIDNFCSSIITCD